MPCGRRRELDFDDGFSTEYFNVEIARSRQQPIFVREHDFGSDNFRAVLVEKFSETCQWHQRRCVNRPVQRARENPVGEVVNELPAPACAITEVRVVDEIC